MFVQSSCKADAVFAGGPLGCILNPFWHPRESKITKTLCFRTVCCLLSGSLNSWPSQTQCILQPFWRLLGYCSRLAAYAFHGLWWPDLHDNTVIYTLFYNFLTPQIPLETLLTNRSLIREIMKMLYFTTVLNIPTWFMDSVRKVVFVSFAFCSTSLFLR